MLLIFTCLKIHKNGGILHVKQKSGYVVAELPVALPRGLPRATLPETNSRSFGDTELGLLYPSGF